MDFGHDNSDTTTFLFGANITANDDTTIVNMETFLPFILDTTCSASQIVLAFTSQQALQMATDHWPSEFTLMTSDAAGSGDGSGGRTFYK